VQWLTYVILTTWKTDIREGHDSRPAQAKCLQEPTPTNKKLGMVVHSCHSSWAGSINRMAVQAGSSINMKPYLKNNQNKKR
jgi:hypothetical protein